jgi:hypothetical protein
MTKQRTAGSSRRSAASAIQRSNVCSMTSANHVSRSSSDSPATRWTSSADIRCGYIPLERMRCSSASRSSGVAARSGWPNSSAVTVPSSPVTSGMTTLPVTSPPMMITGASYTRGACRNLRHSTSVPWMSDA